MKNLIITIAIVCISAICGNTIRAQTGSISGTLTDKINSETLIGATVTLEGTFLGAVTDIDGKYTIDKITEGIYTVKISFIGYEPITEPNVHVKAGSKTILDLKLSTNAKVLKGAHLRRNTQTCIYNSLISGYPVGLLIDGTNCENSASASDLQFKNNIIASCNTPLAVASGSTFNISTWFNDITFGNSIQYTNANLTADPYGTTPDFLPVAGSALLSGADFTGLNLSSFQQVTFRGAFGTTNWTQDWTNWDPQNTAY